MTSVIDSPEQTESVTINPHIGFIDIPWSETGGIMLVPMHISGRSVKPNDKG